MNRQALSPGPFDRCHRRLETVEATAVLIMVCVERQRRTRRACLERAVDMHLLVGEMEGAERQLPSQRCEQLRLLLGIGEVDAGDLRGQLAQCESKPLVDRSIKIVT